jgi:hypothetical protein
MTFKQLCSELEIAITAAYDEGVSLDEAEKLAAKFLSAQLQVSAELKVADLNARMRKSGLKGVRAAIYLSEVSKGDKKPTEAMLTALIDSNETVIDEQQQLDEAEANKAELERYYEIFKDAHIYMRGISKGRFE